MITLTGSASTIDLTAPELRALMRPTSKLQTYALLHWLKRMGLAKRVGYTRPQYNGRYRGGSPPVVWRLPAVITIDLRPEELRRMDDEKVANDPRVEDRP